MKSAKNLGVALYVLASLGSIAMLLFLSITPHAGYVFPQPGAQDLVGVIQSLYQ